MCLFHSPGTSTHHRLPPLPPAFLKSVTVSTLSSSFSAGRRKWMGLGWLSLETSGGTVKWWSLGAWGDRQLSGVVEEEGTAMVVEVVGALLPTSYFGNWCVVPYPQVRVKAKWAFCFPLLTSPRSQISLTMWYHGVITLVIWSAECSCSDAAGNQEIWISCSFVGRNSTGSL